MIRRFFFAIFFILGGFFFYVPKWILMGTKGERQRKKMIKQQAEVLEVERARLRVEQQRP